jgi:abequosyltransferase
MDIPLLSICIPAYSRPRQLAELLQSIDVSGEDVEVVICEDHSPGRELIRKVANEWGDLSALRIAYHENATNLGFDGNIRELVNKASGRFILFMGDDDLFIPGALEEYLKFLKKYHNFNYVLRSYISIHADGAIEKFHYLPKTKILSAGEETAAWIFKRSVNISGFTISRLEALRYATSDLDGTLLYQVYLACCACINGDSVYCDIPVSNAIQSFRQDQPMFGNAISERSRYTPGSVTIDNSINFSKSYLEVAKYLDQKFNVDITNKLVIDLSKYSYPFLSIQRKRGIRVFMDYADQLESNLNLGCTPYFFIYKWALIFLGEKVSDRIILLLKNMLRHTPNL